jgi:hypothetical protein
MMSKSWVKYISGLIVICLCLSFAGCGRSRVFVKRQICPGAQSVDDAIGRVNSQTVNLESFRASGKSQIRYFSKENSFKERFNVKIWLYPPYKVYLQGDIALDGRAIVCGANADEFWFWVRPRLSSYWWGTWSDVSAKSTLFNPRVLIEALGQVRFENRDCWHIENRMGYDILSCVKNGRVVKKVYVSPCDYKVRKIEYFSTTGQIAASAEINNYIDADGGFSVPAKVVVILGLDSGEPFEISIDIKGVKDVDLSPKARRRLFDRPDAEGFDHVMRIGG